MNTVAVSGVGAIIGYGIVSSLRRMEKKTRIIGLDTASNASAKEWCDHFEIVPPVTSENYISNIEKLVTKYKINLYYPGIPQDIKEFYNWYKLGRKFPTKAVVNTQRLLELSFDKWLTYLELRDAGIPTIPTRLTGTFTDLANEFGIPFILKPRYGDSSKGIRRIEDQLDYNYSVAKVRGTAMFQKIVGNDFSEYTVGVFGLGDGTSCGNIALQRRLSYEGWTKEAKVVDDPVLNAKIDELVRLFKPVGPTNLQFRCDNGVYLLLEINARFSSANSIRTSFGYNEAAMCLDYYVRGTTPKPPKIKFGTAVRYTADVIRLDSNNC